MSQRLFPNPQVEQLVPALTGSVLSGSAALMMNASVVAP